MDKTPETNNRDLNKTNKLSILISQDGLCFYVSGKSQINTFYHHEFSESQNPEDLLKKLESAVTTHLGASGKTTVKEVEVFYAHALFCLVPLPYLKKNNLSDYLKFNVKILDTDELTYDQVESVGSGLVYIPYTNINNYLLDEFGEFTYHHFVTDLLRQQTDELNGETETRAFVHIFPTHFTLTVFKNGKLLLCNNYDYVTAVDLAYYVLFAFEQLRIDVESVNLTLSGFVDEKSPVYQLLYRYVRHLSFPAQKNQKYLISPDLKDIPITEYRTFLNTL